MPAIEAQEEGAADEAAHYECAFHILPTIADEEVPGVVEGLKTLVVHVGGTMMSTEIAGRHDLAYEITKQVDGKGRRFNAAHFGWMRFLLAPSALVALAQELSHKPELLRYLVIRLTQDEAQNPFSLLKVSRSDADSADADAVTTEKVEGAVSEEALDQSLAKLVTE